MKRFRYLFCPPGEQGAVAPIVALGLMAFVGFLALGIDLGQIMVVHNELQNVADGAALAAAKELIKEDKAAPGSGRAVVYCDDAINAAIACAGQNRSFGAPNPIVVNGADVTIGEWDVNTKSFLRTGCDPNPNRANAVQVRVTRSAADGTNPQVTTFFSGVLGASSQQNVEATATAILGVAGTLGPDLPYTIPADYLPGGGVASNGLPRILEKLGPQPAYAADPQAYRWKDLGGNNPLQTNRATFAVPTQSEQSNSQLIKYLKGPNMTGGLKFPQKKVGDKLWPMSEWAWGSYVKNTMQAFKDRFNHASTPKVNGKWRVTVPVFKTTNPLAAVPQDSWFRLASRILPGVSQAYACTAYTPAVYTQGFATVDITNVVVNSSCLTSGDQVSQANSCRNTCYADIEVPLTQNTVGTDKGSNPQPVQKDYKDMNSSANEVGVFASTPRIVR